MKNKIKEIQDYFKAKFFKGDFDVIEIGNHTTEIKIDGYKFHLWHSNGAHCFECYSGNYNFIDLEFDKAEKVAGYDYLMTLVKADLRKQKIVRLEQLKKELGELKKEVA